MKFLTSLFIIALVIGMAGHGSAQSALSVVHLSPSKGMITTQTLRNFSVVNTGGTPLSASLFVSLERPGSGEVIATIASRPLSLSVGQTNGLSDVPWISQVFYGDGATAASFAQRGVLEFGEYVICVDVLDEGGVALERSCAEKISVPAQQLSLVYPLNRSDLTERNPTLAWQDVLGLSGSNVTYTLTLVKLEAGQSPAKGLRLNVPVLTRSYLKRNTLLYPLEAPKLEEGVTYAWEVKAVNATGAFLSSQQWTFELKSPTSKAQRQPEYSYAMLRSSSTGQPHLFKDALYIAFDNNESMSGLEYSIYDMTVEKLITDELPEVQGLHPGLNTLKIPISALGLKRDHTYQIAVHTPRKHTYTLDFKIAK